MKKLLFVYLLLISILSKAQNGIEYAFPTKVENKICNFIKLNRGQFSEFFIVFDKLDSSTYFISVMTKKESSKSPSDSLLTLTNRYTLIGDRSIPILFQADTDFLNLGTDIRGRRKHRAIMYHGYEIKFTRDGEILNE